MNRNNSLDNFEELLNNRLLDEAPADDGWNIPSDDIFDQALPYFKKEKKKRRGFFFWFGIGILLIGSGLFISYFKLNNNLEEIHHKIDHLIIHSNENNPDFGADEPCPDDTISNPDCQTISENFQNEIGLLETQKNNNGNPFGNSNISSERASEAGIVFLQEADLVSHGNYIIRKQNQYKNQLIRKTEIFEEELKDQKVTIKNLMEKLPVSCKELALKKRGVEISYTESVKSKPKNKLLRNKLKIGILYVPAFNTAKLSNVDKSYDVLMKGKKFAYANGLGVQFNYHLFGNIHLSTGLLYNDIFIRSKNTLEVAYDSSTEIIDINGIYENKILMEMKSPMGDATANVTIKHDSDVPIPEGDLIESETELKHRICTFEIPLNIEYAMKLSPKFTLNIITGTSFNKALKDHIEFEATLKHHNEVMEQEDSFVSDRTAFTKSFWNYNVGIGGFYNLSPQYSLYFSGHYRQSFKPIVEENGVKTSLQGINLKTGLFYAF